jgi:hypothetical protein
MTKGTRNSCLSSVIRRKSIERNDHSSKVSKTDRAVRYSLMRELNLEKAKSDNSLNTKLKPLVKTTSLKKK